MEKVKHGESKEGAGDSGLRRRWSFLDHNINPTKFKNTRLDPV